MDRRPTSGSHDVDLVIGRAWRDHRRHLLDVGFRMLGDVGEAEDVVQEAFARLVRSDLADIDDVGGWLVVVTSRLCLDRLRARRRHPTAPDDSLGDQAGPAPDPADRVTLDDHVRIALHQVLERLTPAERTAFVLHDVFQYGFDAVAEIVGRTPAACRQLASRARRTIRATEASSRFVIEPAEQRRVTERFIAACTTGDLDGLLEVLDPDVAGEADVGGAIGTRVAGGSGAVAALLLHYLGPDSGTTLLSLPTAGEANVVARRDHHLVVIFSITVRDGRVTHIDGIVDPVKLEPFRAVLGL